MMRETHDGIVERNWHKDFASKRTKRILRSMMGINEALAGVVDDLKLRVSELEARQEVKPIDYKTARLVAPLLACGKVDGQ